MIDTSSIDLLNLIDRDTNLKKVASTGGGEYHGPCPFCGGKDRFVVQPYHTNGGRWFCRHCASPWQDAVEYVKKRYTNGDFRAAVKFLHLESQLESSSPQYTSPDARRARRNPDSPNRPASLQEDYLALTNRGWQAAAKQFVRESKQRLWSPEGRTVLDYLRQRGLTDKIIARAHLGYCPSYKKTKWGGESVSLRRSVVIPWWIEGQFWRVRFRQLDKKLKPVGDDDQKYIQVAGGANGLYGADAIFGRGCKVRDGG